MTQAVWKSYRLAEIAADVAMGPFGSNLKVENFIPSGIPVIRGLNLNYGGFQENNFVFVSESKAKSLKRSLAYPGDLVFTHRGTLGQVGIIPDDQYPYYLVSQSQMRLTARKELVNPRFLYYFFISPTGQRELLRNSSQVGVPAIANPTKSLKEVSVSLPPLSEQERIASILTSLDDKISLNLQENKTLEAIAQAIFKEWFVDFRFPGFNRELVDGLPKGWKNVELGEVFSTVLGGTPSTSEKSYWQNGTIPWINSGKVNEFRIIEPSAYITEDALRNSNTKILKKGTTVIAITGATLGQVSRLEIDSCTNQSVVGIIESESINSAYIYLYVQQNIKNIIKGRTGGAQQHINKNDINKSEFVVPEENILKKFCCMVEPIFSSISNNSFQIRNLMEIRDALLPKLLNGKIRVA